MQFKTEDLFIFENVNGNKEINSTFNFDKARINGTFSFDVNTNNCVDFSKANITGGGIMITDRDSWRKQPNDSNQLNEGAYRWLKKYYNQQNDHERELQYFEKEMNEKCKKLIFWSRGFFHKFFFVLYKYVSNYGNSYIRPLVCFFGISFALYLLGYYMENPVKANFFEDLLNGIISLLGIKGEIDKWYEIIVRLLSIPFLFLFGLGLRNRFKLR